MDRKLFLKQAFQYLVGKGLDTISDNSLVTTLKQAFVKKQRPPGALRDEKDFLKACIGCDACMSACPHNLIFIEDTERRDPLIYPEKKPCKECSDYPCVEACPTTALSLSQNLKPKDIN